VISRKFPHGCRRIRLAAVSLYFLQLASKVSVSY